MYVGKQRTKMSSIRSWYLRSVLDITQIDTSQDTKTYKLQKEEFRNYQARLIERDFRPIKLRSAEF